MYTIVESLLCYNASCVDILLNDYFFGGWGVWRSLRLRLNSAEAEALLDLAELGNILLPKGDDS